MSELLTVTSRDSEIFEAMVRETIATSGANYDPTGESAQETQWELTMSTTLDTIGLGFPHNRQSEATKLTANLTTTNLAQNGPDKSGYDRVLFVRDELGESITSLENGEDKTLQLFAEALGDLTLPQLVGPKADLRAAILERGLLADVSISRIRSSSQRVLASRDTREDHSVGDTRIEYEILEDHYPGDESRIAVAAIRLVRNVAVGVGDFRPEFAHVLEISSNTMHGSDGRPIGSGTLSQQTKAYFLGDAINGVPSPALAPYPDYHQDQGIATADYPGGMTLRDVENALRTNSPLVGPVDEQLLMPLAEALAPRPRS